MNKQALNIEECKRIMIEMLREVDSFCREHGIRYSLAYGTLLGAVRHKGFIPWDDDLDIMMPLPDMIRFKHEFKSDKICFCDVDTWDNFEFSFSRIAHKSTYTQDGLIAKGYGISIDLYPVLGLPDSQDSINLYFDEANRKKKARILLTKVRRNIIKWFPVKTIPFFSRLQKSTRDYLFQYPYENSKYYLCYGGDLEWRCVFDHDLFLRIEELPFEGYSFMAVSCYDEFLSKFYGDYMTPPPEGERHSYHDGVFYWK